MGWSVSHRSMTTLHQRRPALEAQQRWLQPLDDYTLLPKHENRLQIEQAGATPRAGSNK